MNAVLCAETSEHAIYRYVLRRFSNLRIAAKIHKYVVTQKPTKKHFIFITWHIMNPKLHSPARSLTSLGPMTVTPRRRSVEAREAMNRWAGRRRLGWEKMVTMTKALPAMARTVSRARERT